MSSSSSNKRSRDDDDDDEMSEPKRQCVIDLSFDDEPANGMQLATLTRAFNDMFPPATAEVLQRLQNEAFPRRYTGNTFPADYFALGGKYYKWARDINNEPEVWELFGYRKSDVKWFKCVVKHSLLTILGEEVHVVDVGGFNLTFRFNHPYLLKFDQAGSPEVWQFIGFNWSGAEIGEYLRAKLESSDSKIYTERSRYRCRPDLPLSDCEISVIP